MTTTHNRVNLTDAQAGDEIYQAGEWVTIARITIAKSRVSIGYANGGSHTFPLSHGGAVRRAVKKETVDRRPDHVGENAEGDQVAVYDLGTWEVMAIGLALAAYYPADAEGREAEHLRALSKVFGQPGIMQLRVTE